MNTNDVTKKGNKKSLGGLPCTSNLQYQFGENWWWGCEGRSQLMEIHMVKYSDKHSNAVKASEPQKATEEENGRITRYRGGGNTLQDSRRPHCINLVLLRENHSILFLFRIRVWADLIRGWLLLVLLIVWGLHTEERTMSLAEHPSRHKGLGGLVRIAVVDLYSWTTNGGMEWQEPVGSPKLVLLWRHGTSVEPT